MATDLTIRPLSDDELPDALRLLGVAFGNPFDPEDVRDETSVQDASRSHGAFDGDRLVGSVACYSHRLSVPGGEVPCAGTTWVGVLPTDRRRGVMTSLMRAHLEEAVAHGDLVAALWASEPSIYGRFGYGMATESVKVTLAIDAGLRWAAHAPPAADRVRIVPLDEAADVLQPIYDAARARRGGLIARDPSWWGFQVLADRERLRKGAAFKHAAVAEVDGRDVAYAVYGTAGSFGDDGRPDGKVVLIEMAGVDPAAEAAMWRFLASHDLMSVVEAPRRPVDDALPLLVADGRRAHRHPSDGLFVRLLDVPGALSARTYATSAGVTVEVVDDLLDANDGTWRIEVAPEGASITATDEPADLRLPVQALGAAYLGGTELSQLAAAGLVEVRDPGAVHALDAALRPAEAPWASEVW